MIGIVASRLVERYGRPVVLIAGTDGDWKGSGRSTTAFDLHGALAACSEHLERFGGHRAAAGLTIRPEQVEAFAAAFARARRLGADRRRPAAADRGRRDRRRLGARPAAVRGARPARAVRPRQPGRHAARRRLRARRARRRSATASTCASACGSAAATPARRSRSARGAQLDRFRRAGRYDVAFRLQENRWNGTVSPQLVVRRVFDADERFEELRALARRRVEARRGGVERRGARDLRGARARRRRGARGGEPARVGRVPAPARRAVAARRGRLIQARRARGRLPATEDGAAARLTRGPAGARFAPGSSSSSIRATRRSFLVCRRRRNMGRWDSRSGRRLLLVNGVVARAEPAETPGYTGSWRYSNDIRISSRSCSPRSRRTSPTPTGSC